MKKKKSNKIVNNINQKIYIGKTEFSLEKRFKEHCRDALKESNRDRPLYRAMRKYGIENFRIELIEETSNPEEREIYWIEQYGSFKNGYNATLGGDGRHYRDYDLIYSLYQEGKTIQEIAEILNYDKKTWTYKKWHNYLINLVLKNEQYKSDILYNHGLDDCPIIIAKYIK